MHTGGKQVKPTIHSIQNNQTTIETSVEHQRECHSRNTSQTGPQSSNQQQIPLNAYAVPFIPPSYNYFQPPQQQICNTNFPQSSHAAL